MKKIVFVLGILTTLAACNGSKLSEELQASLDSFEQGWQTCGNDITAFGDKMESSFSHMNSMMETSNQLPSPTKDAVRMRSVDSLKAICQGLTRRMDIIQTSYTATTDAFSKETAAFQTWKAKLMAGEISEEQATVTLNDFSTKLSAYQDNVKAWGNMVGELEGHCTATCKAIESMSR